MFQFVPDLNRKIKFFIDNIYYEHEKSIHKIFMDTITDILNVCIVKKKKLLSLEVFNKLLTLGFNFTPYLNDMIIIGLFDNDVDIIKFVRTHYNIPDILQSLNLRIMKI